jgi:hypothetical protein
MKQLWLRLYDWWNLPCPKHPDHRVNEIDAELLTGCAMMPRMCSLCWKEWDDQCKAGSQ